MSSSGRRSTAWNHFTDTDTIGKVKCKYCGKIVTVSRNSTGNLVRHLTRHPGVSTTRALPPSVPQRLAQEPAGTSTGAVTNTTTSASSASAIVAAPTPSSVHPLMSQQIQNYLVKPISTKKSTEIDTQLVRMITKEYHPFSLVEDPEFKKLVYILCPSYKLPTRKTLTTSLIPAAYNEMRDKVLARLKRAFAVCITADGWTSRSNDCFIAVTAHYIVEEPDQTKMASDLLGCFSMPERHTALNICSKMKAIFEMYSIEQRIAIVVTDNAHNMTAALRLGGWRFWGCFAHSLNLIVQAGVKEIDVTLKKVRSIVSFFRRSAHASSELKKTQERMGLSIVKLKIDVSTRWNSTMLMIQRIVAVKMALLSTLAIINAGAQQSAAADIECLTNTEWIVIEQTTELLEIFDVITQVISSETEVTASSITIFHKQICKHLIKTLSRPELMPATRLVAEKLKTECASRFEKLEDSEMIAQCTLLDPRFKKLGFMNELKCAKALSGLIGQVSRINLTSNSDAAPEVLPSVQTTVSSSSTNLGRKESLLWKEFDEEAQKYQRPENPTAAAVVEVNKYIDEPYLSRQEDPLVWWHQRRTVYPRLYQLMKKRLCMVATSVPCERIFSKGGQIVSEKRTRLTTKKVEEIIFLAYNLGNDE